MAKIVALIAAVFILALLRGPAEHLALGDPLLGAAGRRRGCLLAIPVGHARQDDRFGADRRRAHRTAAVATSMHRALFCVRCVRASAGTRIPLDRL